MFDSIPRIVRPALVALGLFAAPAAFAQAETDLDDFDLSDEPTSTVGSEVQDLRDDEVETEDDTPTVKRKKRVIKTLQRKTFMKIGRTELGLGAGLVTNDPFINRYIIRGDVGYHFTEVSALQVEVGLSPDFERSDWKQITRQIVEENGVTPDISKILGYGNVTLQYAPIYGKVASGNAIINFDIYGLFGTGVVYTADDLEALQSENDEIAVKTANQVHPTLNFGGGARIVFGRNLALRIEGRGLSYIEVLESLNLEMKNNFIVQANVSYFLGKGKSR